MAEVLWQSLHVGDVIRIACMPREFDTSGYYLHSDTRKLYKFLIDHAIPLSITRIDEGNYPWTEFALRSVKRSAEYHSLMLNHDGLELISSNQ